MTQFNGARVNLVGINESKDFTETSGRYSFVTLQTQNKFSANSESLVIINFFG